MILSALGYFSKKLKTMKSHIKETWLGYEYVTIMMIHVLGYHKCTGQRAVHEQSLQYANCCFYSNQAIAMKRSKSMQLNNLNIDIHVEVI